MTEANRTKWVGVRPTEPEEAIPVKQSTPADLQTTVTPAAGSTWEVIQSTPADLQATVTPATGAEFTVSQTDTTKLKVGEARVYGYETATPSWVPLIVSQNGELIVDEPLTVEQPSRGSLISTTYKPSPAVADIGSIEAAYGETKSNTNCSAGSNVLTFTAAPVGKMLIITRCAGYAWLGAPSEVFWTVTIGGSNHYPYIISSPGNKSEIGFTATLVLDAGDQIKVTFNGMAAGDDIYASIFGYKIDKY